MGPLGNPSLGVEFENHLFLTCLFIFLSLELTTNLSETRNEPAFYPRAIPFLSCPLIIRAGTLATLHPIPRRRYHHNVKYFSTKCLLRLRLDRLSFWDSSSPPISCVRRSWTRALTSLVLNVSISTQSCQSISAWLYLLIFACIATSIAHRPFDPGPKAAFSRHQEMRTRHPWRCGSKASVCSLCIIYLRNQIFLFSPATYFDHGTN